MAQPTVALGGRTWQLRFDMNAIAELEDALKLTIEEIGGRLMRGRMGFREVRALVWAALLHENDNLGIKTVGAWLNEAGVLKDQATRESLTQKVLDSLRMAFPDAAKETDGTDPN